jgi:hypothetical protein
MLEVADEAEGDEEDEVEVEDEDEDEAVEVRPHSLHQLLQQEMLFHQ